MFPHAGGGIAYSAGSESIVDYWPGSTGIDPASNDAAYGSVYASMATELVLVDVTQDANRLVQGTQKTTIRNQFQSGQQFALTVRLMDRYGQNVTNLSHSVLGPNIEITAQGAGVRTVLAMNGATATLNCATGQAPVPRVLIWHVATFQPAHPPSSWLEKEMECELTT